MRKSRNGFIIHFVISLKADRPYKATVVYNLATVVYSDIPQFAVIYQLYTTVQGFDVAHAKCYTHTHTHTYIYLMHTTKVTHAYNYTTLNTFLETNTFLCRRTRSLLRFNCSKNSQHGINYTVGTYIHKPVCLGACVWVVKKLYFVYRIGNQRIVQKKVVVMRALIFRVVSPLQISNLLHSGL